jgi:hypothetical protein
VAARQRELTAGPSGGPGRIFLLSPADSSGKRARLLEDSDIDLARRLRARSGAPIGEVFSFVSSLYFRGKLTYASAFARPPGGAMGIHVITPGDGLRSPDSVVRLADLVRYAGVDVDPDEPAYREPFLRDLRALAPGWAGCEVVLLGSIASGKYADLLTDVLGERIVFPAEFVGRGDMSRGGLLLRCAEEGRELAYVSIRGAARRGPRPARLPPPVRRKREVI